MKKMPFLLLAFFIFMGCSCVPIKYEDDLTFISSGYAGNAEAFARINQKSCVSGEGQIGVCYRSIKKNLDLDFKLLKQSYDYRFRFTCSKNIRATYQESPGSPIDVLKENEFTFKIDKGEYLDADEFICRGRIFPMDRPDDVSSFFEVRVLLINPEYQMRENSYVTTKDKKKYLVLGKQAYLSKIFIDGKWQGFKEKTAIELKSENFCAMSESKKMRMNHFCLGMSWDQIP